MVIYGYRKNPDHSVADREQKEKKKNHIPLKDKQMNKKIHPENRRGKKIGENR